MLADIKSGHSLPEKILRKRGLKGTDLSPSPCQTFQAYTIEQVFFFKQATQTWLQAYATTQTYSKKEHQVSDKYWE